MKLFSLLPKRLVHLACNSPIFFRSSSLLFALRSSIPHSCNHAIALPALPPIPVKRSTIFRIFAFLSPRPSPIISALFDPLP